MPSGSRTADLRHVDLQGRPVIRGQNARRGGGSPPRLATAAEARASGFPARVLQRAGLDPAVYRDAPLQRRMSACLRALRARDEREAEQRVHADPSALREALGSLLIGVSSFFRDEALFAALAERVVPALAASGAPLRVWSAGCAAGQELLSVGVLLVEAGLLERATLVGSDCRPDALAAAAAGVYPELALPARWQHMRERCFERVPPAHWRAAAQLRRAVEWRVGDVASNVEPGPWDLVLWRNVAIYMTRDAARRALAALAETLRPGGWLMVGSAERFDAAEPGLEAQGRSLYRKRLEVR